MENKTMALYLSQERWGRVCLHFVAALRAGHWGWHLAGIGREIECIWPQTHRACGYREALTRTRRQPKGKTNMSAKALAACSFEPAAEQTVATGRQAPEGTAAEIQFREDLWREYRLEAINAGFSAAQATEYATALSSAMGLVAGVSEMAPVERGWFYQSRIRGGQANNHLRADQAYATGKRQDHRANRSRGPLQISPRVPLVERRRKKLKQGKTTRE